MAAPYKSKIEALIAQARSAADSWAEKESDLASQRSDALEEFADALEDAMNELENAWEA